MANNRLSLNGFDIAVHEVNTLIIGSGAASLNAALSLHRFGVDDIVIVTSEWGGGTSNNAGSDKQTYYKLSLSGMEPDSVYTMAGDLFKGRCMHGDIALCEAQGSIQSFMRLVELGVKFPVDQYGSFAGYKTDHDPRSRATSAGPYTSKRMFEALAGEVKRKGIHILDHHHCISLLTDCHGKSVIGALAINSDETDYRKSFVLFNALNIILGSGGPAGIYESSVYPHSQEGSTGMAFLAGATGQNLIESQFGIASVRFRWNLSGSYQQAIPGYISRKRDGTDEKEFLNGHFPDLRTLTRAIFLKGYQWPFDPAKISDYGSSMIDVLVDAEINEYGREVFLDYTRNPAGRNGEEFSADNLDPVVEEYLRKCNALGETPIERLKSINPPAIQLYLDHGIDLSSEILQIAVCAQHNNGGLKGNIWWESDLQHLFPVGEVNGSHGVYRPGGSALNAGQVGSFRAARYISKKYNGSPGSLNRILDEAGKKLNETLEQSVKWMFHPEKSDTVNYFTEIRKRMSAFGGIVRDNSKSDEAALLANEMLIALPERIGARDVRSLLGCFRLIDQCLTHFIYLKAIHHYINEGGRSRGSYIVTPGGTKQHPDLCCFDREIEMNIIECSYRDGVLEFQSREVREIPEQDLWFEKVWKEYLEDN